MVTPAAVSSTHVRHTTTTILPSVTVENIPPVAEATVGELSTLDMSTTTLISTIQDGMSITEYSKLYHK